MRHVLEGSLRQSGNRIRVTAQLVEAATDNHVWTERYGSDLADILIACPIIGGNIAGGQHYIVIELEGGDLRRGQGGRLRR